MMVNHNRWIQSCRLRASIYSAAIIVNLVIGFNVSMVQAAAEHATAYESELLAIVSHIQNGQLDQALQLNQQHLDRYPKSRVGHLLKAEVLQAMSSGYGDIANFNASQPATENPLQTKAVANLKKQIKSRWQHNQNHEVWEAQQVPSSLVMMGKHQHVLVADLAAGRLYLFANEQGEPKLLRDYYLSVGSEGYGKQVEGDNKTPIGVYSIYRHIPAGQLPDLYGNGAFPIDYPNKIDKYHKRTGYGIWLHGTPSDTYARSPWSSEGCFVLSNADINDISQFIDVENKTPVILSDSINWISKQQLLADREAYLQLLDNWQSDWESLDTSAYVAHYSAENFNLGKGNYDDWVASKAAINESKTFVKVDIDIEALFVYPGEENMFVVDYKQGYFSNNHNANSNKQQFWQRDDNGIWRIIYEQ